MNETLLLESAILDTELRHINFFNGRLLSGEDLSAERDANHAHLRQLGQAIGAGVACGLEVSRAQSSPPGDVQVVVTAGLAVNKEGQALRLASDQTVSLVRTPDPAKKAECVFSDCALFAAGGTLSGNGYFLLTIAPAAQREGLAPISGLGNGSAPCNSRYFTEGVQLRLVPLRVSPVPDAAHARNLVAYQCLGAVDPAVQSFLSDPFGPDLSSYGLVDQVDPLRLTPADVPLAVVAFNALDGLQFMDQWSVRRRLTRLSPDRHWPLLVSDRRTSEGEAMFLQFQEQIEDIRQSESNLDQFVATQALGFLPPAGLLSLSAVGSNPGLSYLKFFEGQAYHPPLLIEGALMEPMIRTAFAYRPVDLGRKDPLRLFQIVDGGVIRPYLLFTSALMPFDGAARFDIVRWNFANFAG
jgi:hypothetical protein